MNHFLHKLAFPLSLLIMAVSVLLFFPGKREVIYGCAGPIDEKALSAGFDAKATTGEFEGKLVQVPQIVTTLTAQVLGEASDKRIEVDLGKQRVYAYEGGNRVFEFVVSTGKWAATPRGTFAIVTKVSAQKMSGGNRANGTYYYLPNVPWVMFFGNSEIPWTRGYSLHGTYWHNNFGQPMSHGCVNMKIPDSEFLYQWTPVGTKVVIY